MNKPLTYNATIIERVDMTSALAIFKIRPDEPVLDQPPFVPGQYMTLGLNNQARPELGSVRRPMSIASAPEEQDAFEFYIRYVSHPESENPLTHLLWQVRAQDRIFLRSKAVGTFTLEDTVGADDPRLKVMVAAGTGLAPFISIVRSHKLRHPSPDLHGFAILHGASYPADLGYQSELNQLSAQYGLHYLKTVSRASEARDWSGDRGRVEDFFLPDRLADLEARLGLGPGEFHPDRAVIMICGLQGTISNTLVRLLSRGFVPENRKLRRALEVPDDVPASLFFEQYDNTPVIEVDDPAVLAPLREQLRSALQRVIPDRA